MRRFVLSTVSGVVACALVGCATQPGADPLGSVVRAGLNSLTQPQVVDAYQAAATRDRQVFAEAFVRLDPKTIGHQPIDNDLAETMVRFVRGSQEWSVRVVHQARLALPADAVSARHRAVGQAVEAFARYANTRQDAASMRFFVSAPDAADRAWLMQQLRSAGVGTVAVMSYPYVSVGFTSPALPLIRKV